MDEIVFLPISSLRFSTRTRRGVSPRRVDEIRRELERDREIHPIRVRRIGEGLYTVADGRHRLQAHILAGYAFIAAVVDNMLEKIRRLFQTVVPFWNSGFFLENL